MTETSPQGTEGGLLAEEIRDAWPALDLAGAARGLPAARHRQRPRSSSSGSTARDQCELLLALAPSERQLWMRQLAPDDAADVVQQAPEDEREALLAAARRADPRVR